ncbi:hypothetical protein K7I13_02160 [Brucepastera parasyntrophica]|uniref:hypothetical protein n=1 Tax=Brucepastera parasyntrophica TaxID=2880008 RepID=UPI00210C2F57|nr:hypothetical protein [Brucepastera parasyntrophica]ULQ60149.1 hypothetical protein K7I13_02160 [Brucepastera parasyntrophica]
MIGQMHNQLIIPAMVFFSLTCFFPGAETVRDRASAHFNAIDWSYNPDAVLHGETPGVTVPGGNETFPVLSVTDTTDTDVIYPSAPGVGFIDYSGIDETLISLLYKLADALKTKKIPSDINLPSRPFISVLTEYRLNKLPEIRTVFFSRPMLLENNISEAVYSLRIITENTPKYLYLSVNAVYSENTWFINDIVFDGETYAELAEQN